jgi:predicted nucleotidyltransferase
MAKIPKKPQEIFEEITGEYQKIFGADLVSIILFGSGAGEEYLPGKSDINFLIMLTDHGIDRLDRALETVARWRKRSVAIPLFMTRSYLEGARDAYPIELLNMKRHYVVVFGKDVLAELVFDRRHVRLQLERELRGKLLHLRSGYLATEGSAGKIRSLITLSLTAFISLFSALLYLKEIEIPHGKRDIITEAGKAFGIDAATFLKCEEIRRKTDRFSQNEVKAVFQAYMKEVSRLCDQIDQMEI